MYGVIRLLRCSSGLRYAAHSLAILLQITFDKIIYKCYSIFTIKCSIFF